MIWIDKESSRPKRLGIQGDMLDQLWGNFRRWYGRTQFWVEGADQIQQNPTVAVGIAKCFRLLRDRTRSIARIANQFEWIVVVFAMMVVEAMFVIVIGMATEDHQGWNWRLLS